MSTQTASLLGAGHNELPLVEPAPPTPEEWLETARGLAADFSLGAADRDRERRFPHDELSQLGASGLDGLIVPRAYGGLDGTYADTARVMQLLAEGDSSIAMIFQSQLWGVDIARRTATESFQRSAFTRRDDGTLPRWFNAYSEVGTANALSYDVTVTPQPGGEEYILQGEKYYTTGSPGADLLYALSLLGGTEEFRLAILSATDPGVTIHDDWDGIGQATTGSGKVSFDQVIIPAENVVGVDIFLEPTNIFGLISQVQHVAILLGIGRAALRDAVSYVRAKTRPWALSDVQRLSEDPYVQLRVGEVRALLDGADALAERALGHLHAAEIDATEETRAAASVAIAEAKNLAVRAALDAGSVLFQVGGTSSASDRHRFDRHWRNARVLSLHDPQDHKLKLIGDYALNGTRPTPTIYT